jgi:ATP-dependent Clp protease protease subunit
MKKLDDHSVKEPEAPSHGYFETYVKASKSRVIFFSDVVTKKSAADLAAMLLYYDNMSHEEPIYLYINSPGGDASGLVCIYDIMQMINAPVKTICMGRAYSAGAVLLAAGTGGRFAFKNSEIMVHGIQCIFPLPGEDIASSKNYFSFLKDNDDNIMKILANHTGHPLAKIKKDFEQDVWLSPKEALDYGIIDDII